MLRDAGGAPASRRRRPGAGQARDAGAGRLPGPGDLGIYTEYVKQLAHLRAPIVDVRGPGFNLLGDHFQVIMALIAPFFRVFPSPSTLLVAQALLVAVSVFPVTQAAVALLGRGTGRAIRS